MHNAEKPGRKSNSRKSNSRKNNSHKNNIHKNNGTTKNDAENRFCTAPCPAHNDQKNHVAESLVAENHVSENQAPENHVSENQAPENQTSANEKPENSHFANFRADSLVAGHYTDIHGQRQNIDESIRQLLLNAIGDTPDDGAPLPPVLVFTDQQITLTPAGSGDYHWTLTSEQGTQTEGNCSAGQPLTLPVSLPQGYHTLTLSQQTQNQPPLQQQYQQQHYQHQQWHCRLIIAPQRCYQPAALLNNQKLWGSCVQLYTLRSLNNWGVGDFGDLQKLVRETTRYQAAFIGLNPLHALYPAQPDNASPYSPSSRQWLNIIYIDVNAVEDFQINAEAEAWWIQPDTQQQLNAVRNSEWVDYPAVMALKLAALAIAWRKFLTRNERDSLMREFRQFVETGGDSLYWYAVYDALHQWLIRQNAQYSDWSQWPSPYQQPHSDQVSEFCRNNARDIEFYCWLQWLAQRQLAACWQASQKATMPLGLYRDLAVGVARHGAETWYNRALYCMDMAIGAPPDPLGPQGQNWQLPPVNPQQLIARAYQPFIDLLRANMRYCGALRIDHVMSLMRLWWVPDGKSATEGAYVQYPLDDLLAILALESQRQQCVIIGEDLGIVPPELAGKLRDSGIYSYKVLYFERNQQQELPAPDDWPPQALATVNTHDLPTLHDYWREGDLQRGKNLGIYTDETLLEQLHQQRQRQKQMIVTVLNRYRCLPPRSTHEANRKGMTQILCRALYHYMASCQSALVGVQPDDWLDMSLPVNVPGTDRQYPNWRRKLNRTLEEIFMDPTIARLMSTLKKYRKQASKQTG